MSASREQRSDVPKQPIVALAFRPVPEAIECGGGVQGNGTRKDVVRLRGKEMSDAAEGPTRRLRIR